MPNIAENTVGRHTGFFGVDYLKFRAFGRYEWAETKVVKTSVDDEERGEGWQKVVMAQEEGLYDLLEERAEEARSTGHDVYVELDGISFKVRGYGSGPYGVNRRAYQLEACGCYFGVSPSSNLGDKDKPKLWVEIKGELLTMHGFNDAIKIARKCMRALGFKYSYSRLTRVDLRTDFTDVTPDQIHDLYRGGHVVTNASHKGCQVFYGAGRKVESIYFGSRASKSDVILRIYDKIAEAGKNISKQMLIEEHILRGEISDVLTRVEFELSRKALQKLVTDVKVISVEDLVGSMGKLIDVLTRKYFRIYDKEVDRTNTTRGGDFHPVWDIVCNRFDRFAKCYKESKPLPDRTRRQNVCQIKNTIIGYVAKIAALTGYKVRSGFELMMFVEQQLEDAFSNPTAFSKRVQEKTLKLRAEQLEDARRMVEAMEFA